MRGHSDSFLKVAMSGDPDCSKCNDDDSKCNCK